MKLAGISQWAISLGGALLYMLLASKDQKLICSFVNGLVICLMLEQINHVYHATLPLFQRIVSAAIVLTGGVAIFRVVLQDCFKTMWRLPVPSAMLMQGVLLALLVIPLDSWARYRLLKQERPHYGLW
ncbi:hypothetical protein [Intestinibacillus massiliensis]